MKKSVFLVLLMLAGVHTAFAQRYDLKVWKNGAYVQYMVNSVDSVTYSKLVESIEILPATLELQIGETYQMNATIMPEDADNRTYTWECSPHVIISETGLVKGMVKGVGTITCKANDGSGVSATCQVTITKPDGGEPEEYEYVDLGLPSGTLWATMNVGASNPEECGDYFAWGEVYPKES